MMKLKEFQVTDFRSVKDSGLIRTDDVTALIGINESGKTNVLLPLWKLNPAKEGGVVPLDDYPRKHYHELRNQSPKPVFIRATFDSGEELAEEMGAKAGMPAEMLREVAVSRRFDAADFDVDFPKATPRRTATSGEVDGLLERAVRDIDGITALKTEEDLKKTILGALGLARKVAQGKKELMAAELAAVVSELEAAKLDGAPKSSAIVPRFRRLADDLGSLKEQLSRDHPRDVESVVALVRENLPKFVYYSTYGNLDSEIYLPHVIANLARSDLGEKERAKARTLRVLFDFVKLQPKEILELGRDFRDANRQPSEDEIARIAEKKKERSILLQAASSQLTSEFRDWWKQGEYRFRFQADGDHFRIWVSDDRRPDEVELEGRSTGLQWFLGFYLVFLVEKAAAHKGAILLLDEPGLSLHPLAQIDLSAFFDGLAKTNQILYTCHSPFLIDADRLDRARKVYVGGDGTSVVSEDLRAPDDDAGQRGASYAVFAALGLSVAESLLLGCTPVIVEGVSDQHYLTTMKSLLIAAGRLKPSRELVFPPSGGTKGVKPICALLAGKNEELPFVLFDSDEAGRAAAKSLRGALYSGSPERVLEVGRFTKLANAEIEDLIPAPILIHQVDRWQRGPDVPFKSEYASGGPIVPQIEAWATKHGLTLESPGWKVELAKRVKQQLLADGPESVDAETLGLWARVFETFSGLPEPDGTPPA